MQETKLADVKIEDASYSLQTLFKSLTWLEKNGWKLSQTTENDLLGHGCGIYPKSKHVDVSVHMIRENDEKSYLFENDTKVKEI